MSAVEIDAGTSLAAASGGADEISRRLESLPASAYVWRLVILLSHGDLDPAALRAGKPALAGAQRPGR